MEKSGVVYLALVPLVAPETGVITEVAAIIGKDPYGTRLLLAGKVPKIVAHYEGKQTAESVAQRLRDLGLVPILCTESELCRSSEGFITYSGSGTGICPVLRPGWAKTGDEVQGCLLDYQGQGGDLCD